MKKIIILILMIVAFPMSVLADHGAPQIQPYKATIDDVNGVICRRGYTNENYEYITEDYVLKYGDVVTVSSESVQKNKMYSYIVYNDEVQCEILTDQIKPVLANYKISEHLDEVQKTSEEVDVKVINKRGLSIYSGPSYGYEVIGNIPFDTDLKYSYFSGRFGKLWIYVNYEGVEGWVCTFRVTDSGLSIDIGSENDNATITPSEIIIYEDDKEEKELGRIPAFTVIDKYYTLDMSHLSYLEFNGVNGYAYLPEIKKLNESKVITTTFPLELTEKTWGQYNYLEQVPSLVSIPVGTSLNFEYFCNEVGDYYSLYVEYDGKKGWIYLLDLDYDDLSYNLNSEVKKLLGDIVEIEPPVDAPETEDEPEADKEPVKNDKDKNKGLTGKEIVIICVFGSVVIAVTAVVTIILVNKKKKKNNEIKIEEKENIVEAAKDEVDEVVVNKVEESIEEEKPVAKKGKRKTKEK